MGRWDRRWIPRRRYNSKKYRDYDYEEPPPSPPSPHHPQSNPPPILENGGSSWEIDFCKSVRVPWKKILAAKNFMHCYENVVKWDDSAAEEAFHDAKRRYWEKIHCFPCETPLPDKDMYNDEINWNPYIDPNLILDLDWEYFNPDEVGKLDTLHTSSKGRNNSLPVCGPLQNDENPDKLHRETDAAQVGDPNGTMRHWAQCTKSINSKDVTNPWEQSCTLLDKSLKNNAWEGSFQEVGDGWIHTAKLMDSRDVNNPWEQSRVQLDESLRNNAWKGSTGEDPTQGVRTKSTNSKDLNNPWEQSLSQSDKSLTTNAWKGYAVADPRGVRTHWGPNFNSIDLKEVNNPWEQSLDRFDDSLNNARKGYAGESPSMMVGAHSVQYGISVNPKDVNPWEQSCNPAYNKWSAENAGDKQWVHVNDRPRGQKQWFSSHKQQHPVNTERTWRRSFPSHTGATRDSRGWREHGNKFWGWKQAEHNNRSKNVNYKGYSGGRAVEQSGCRKRECPLQHSPKHKTSRFRDDSYMTAKK